MSLDAGQKVLGDKAVLSLPKRAYVASWLRGLGVRWLGERTIQVLTKRPICISPWLYKQRNLVERLLIATRYDKLGSAFCAMVKLACIRIRPRHYESTASPGAVLRKNRNSGCNSLSAVYS